MRRVLHIDLETYSSVDIGKAGLYKYAQSQDFEILLFAYSFNDESNVHVVDLTETPSLPDAVLNALDDPDVELWAHNAAFEWYCLSRYLHREPASWADRWRCTMIYGLYLAFPPSLKELGVALNIPADAQKDKIGKALIKYFCCPCKATKSNGGRTRNLPEHDMEKWKLFIEYNRQDVVAEKKIHEYLSEVPIPDFIWHQWHQDLRMNERGVRVNKKMMDGALRIDARSTELLKAEMVKLTGLQNPKSVQQLAGWIEQQTGERPESLRAEYLEEMAEDESLPRLVRHVLNLKLLISKTSISKYAAMERAMGEGGKVRGMLQFYGASRTGRWAGRIVQLQNLARTHLDALDMAREICEMGDYDEMQLWYGNVPSTLSQLVRTCLIPDEGQVFVDADFSAIEARVIAWLAGEEWTLEVFRTTGKIYEATAANMFGVPAESIAKGKPNYPLRQRGKVATLALGYQGGEGALVAMGALKMGIPEDDLTDIKQKWRKANPNIVRLWDLCNRAAIQTIETGHSCRVRGLLTFSLVETEHLRMMAIKLPSGRQIFYPNPGIGVNKFGAKSITYWGTSTGSGDKQSSKKWRQLETYGGKVTENCLAGNTLVLTDVGLVPIKEVSPRHHVWDGVAWVSHDGVICQGERPTVRVGGLTMTPDHKVLTEKGWVRCGKAEGLNWATVQLPDCTAPRTSRITVRPAGLSETVFDLRNCGSRHRFCVYDPEEKQFRIVSNCVQAIARDCLAVNLDRLEKAGFDVRFHIHDEVVCSQDTDCLDEVVKIMSQPIDWAPGLPLNADGWCGNYFTKD